ncbi:TonB-dependent receptor [Olivibacter sp. SDN3]|nr:TonB-dependent receptor [Olivibacter sp. SDN3]
MTRIAIINRLSTIRVYGLLLFLCAGTAFLPTSASRAQQTQPLVNSTLQGVVKDAKTGEVLTGATVSIQGTTHKASTDEQGSFQFVTGQQFPYTLIINYIGYEPLELVVDKSPVTILLEPNLNQLEDVVVVGYGTQKRADLTGSVSSIGAEAIQESPAASFDQAIRGRASGVQVTSTSNQPGGATSIRIRGSNSVNTGSEPLYVIDGFPVYNDNEGSSAGATVGPATNALSLINPEDIVSMEVLKDASASAIYGSRGANGVILITTKQGQAGRNKFQFNSYYASQRVRKKLDLLDATEFAQLVNDANGNDIYSPEEIASFGAGTDWQDEIFQTAPMQNYQLGASGGDEKTKYALSLNYFNQQGIIVNSGFKRYAARFNLERKATDKLTFGLHLTSSRSDANQALSATSGGEGTIGVVQSALAFSPILPVYQANGSYVLENDRGIPMGNPVATARELTNQTRSYRTLGNLFAEYEIIEGLRFKTSIGADVLNNKENYYAPRTTLAGYSVQGLGRVGTLSSYSILNENTLSYQRRFGEHQMDVLAGFTAQKFERELVLASASGFVNDLLGPDNLGAGSLINAPTTNINNWSLLSWIGRANYSYRDKLLLTLTGRIDGSSKFGVNSRYGFFPSGALAYKLSEEDFIKNLNTFSELKIRTSYGRTGNQEIDSYQSLARLGSMSYVIGDNVVRGFSPDNIANPDLKWESTAQFDVGLDAGFLDGRINVTADLYYKKTKDMLLWVNVPWSSGFSSALQNIGSMENRGLELALQANIIDRTFKWSANANIAFNQNKVTDLGPISEILTGEINGYLKLNDPIVIRPGQALNSFYGYVSQGIFQLGDDIENSPQPNAAPGDRKYADSNGDGILDARDRTFLGSAQPKHFGGMTHHFSYKNLDLGLFFNWVYGNKILNSTRTELDLPTGQKNSAARVVDRWTPENPSNTIPRADLSRAFLFSDAQLEDGSYLRLGTATLGYTFGKDLFSNTSIEQLRIYVSALNLWTWTNYTGYDPEVNQSGQDNILRGIDSDAYPSTKSWLFGLTLNF